MRIKNILHLHFRWFPKLGVYGSEYTLRRDLEFESRMFFIGTFYANGSLVYQLHYDVKDVEIYSNEVRIVPWDKANNQVVRVPTAYREGSFYKLWYKDGETSILLSRDRFPTSGLARRFLERALNAPVECRLLWADDPWMRCRTPIEVDIDRFARFLEGREH